MEAYKQRVLDEKDQLTAKIHALDTFTRGPQIKTLDEVDQLLLIMQLQTMRMYQCILSQRIQRF